MNPALRELLELWAAGAPLVTLITTEEERAIELCQAAAHRAGASFGVWSLHRGLDPMDPEARSPLAVLDALERAPSPLLVALLDFHISLTDPSVARRLRDLLPRLATDDRCVVVIAPRATLPEGLAAEGTLVTLPLPDERERAELLGAVSEHFASAKPPTEGERARAVAAAAGLTSTQARRAFARAYAVHGALGPAAVNVIAGEKKRILARDLGLEIIDDLDKPEDIGGLEGFKNWLAERAHAMTPEARRAGLTAPKGVLLVGVQGCGKSLSAKCTAAQLGVPLLRLDLPRVLGAGGEGPSAEESLRRALMAAEAIAPVALWVDEIEKGFAGSSPGRTIDSRASRLLGAFSTWLQERKSQIFVVATANDVSSLPPELLRRGRFDELFFVDLPDYEARRAILDVHLRRRGRNPKTFDLNALSEQCQDFSGAEIEQVVVGGMHRAFAAGRELEPADLRRVAHDLVPLYKTYEEQIKDLREWARGRARFAGREGALVDLFRRAE